MAVRGLSADEVNQRRASGLVNTVESSVSRSYRDIFIENFLNWFNLILILLGIALYLLGEYTSAVSATGIIALNILVSTFQEIKAKRRLDKIALLLRPKVMVIRDRSEREIDQSEIVMDDVVHLVSGDQALVDGEIIEMRSLEMDEAALSGESSPVRKRVGDTIFSGSYCVTGEAYFRTTALGSDTYASKMLVSARIYKKKKTPLQMETTAVTQLLISVAALILVIYTVLKLVTGANTTPNELLKTATIILDVVPIALFLLITLTYMIAAIRMADTGLLLQRSNSVESMSHVNTVCMDKTGTITTNRLVFKKIDLRMEEDRARKLIRIFMGSTGSRNRTVEVLRGEFGSEESNLIEEVQFSSERKYSAVRTEKDGTEYVVLMGVWDTLKDHVEDTMDIQEAITSLSRQGLRNVVLCEGSGRLFDGEEPVIPNGLRIIGVASMEDEVRADCRETMDVFLKNGIDIKVISGDDPETVNALFSIADIPGERRIISGDELDTLKGQEKTDTILATNIFGRMRPDHKEMIIDTLKLNNRYVAMVGDGVNDVKAIKAAQVGIALESGSGATRGAADMVLMRDNFAALPKAIVEGRRTVTGMRDILKIYLTRNFTLVFLIIFTLLLLGNAPLLPIQNTMYAFLTVSISAFLMTLWAEPDDNGDMVLPEVIRFAIPSAFLIGLFGTVIYIIFYFGTGTFINIDYHTMAESAGIPYIDLVKSLDLAGTDATIGMFENDVREINARNAMLFFIMLAGILELLLVHPIHRFLSVNERKVTKDIKPTLLVVLLLLLFSCVYFVPATDWFVIKYISTAVFPAEYYLPIIGLTLVWLFVLRTALRSGLFSFLSIRTETWFNDKLNKEVEKSMREDGAADQGE
ncbi:MAG: HAD-IC family P-type ATPase [Candidatus Methanomethylophilaceae archaeon]